MSDQWSDKLRRQMDAHHEPSPEGLWEDIEHTLDKEDSTKRRIIFLWMKSATAVAAVVTMGIFISKNISDDKKQAVSHAAIKTVNNHTVQDTLRDLNSQNERNIASEESRTNSSPEVKTARESAAYYADSRDTLSRTYKIQAKASVEYGKKKHLFNSKKSRNEQISVNAQSMIASLSDNGSKSSLSETGNSNEKSTGMLTDSRLNNIDEGNMKSMPENTQTQAAADRSTDQKSALIPAGTANTDSAALKVKKLEYMNFFASASEQPESKPDKNFIKWVASVYASKIPIGSTQKYEGYGNLTSGVKAPEEDGETPNNGDDPYKSIITENLSKAVSTDIKHRQPIVMGVTLGYSLNERWSINGGLTYTILTSQLRSGSSTSYYTGKQTLQDIGLCLNTCYTIVKGDRFSIYLSGGGLVEKNIAGRLTTDYYIDSKVQSKEEENVSIDQLLWSVNGSVGVQYNVLTRVGIYAEPGASYYFKNRSEVETIYKDKPVSLSLRFGLRFALGD